MPLKPQGCFPEIVKTISIMELIQHNLFTLEADPSNLLVSSANSK